MAEARVTSEHADVVATHPTGARISTEHVDVVTVGGMRVYVSTEHVDVITRSVNVARVTGATAEVVVGMTKAARITGAVAEVVVGVITGARISAAVAEAVITNVGVVALGAAQADVTFGASAASLQVIKAITGATSVTVGASVSHLEVPLFYGTGELALDMHLGTHGHIQFPAPAPVVAPSWTWCETLTAWVGTAGSIPEGWTYPTDGSNDPDMTPHAPADDQEITIFGGAASYDPCADGWHWHDGNHLDWYAGVWAQYGTPTGTHLYVVAGGPMWDDTDPMPTWNPAEVFFAPEPTSTLTLAARADLTAPPVSFNGTGLFFLQPYHRLNFQGLGALQLNYGRKVASAAILFSGDSDLQIRSISILAQQIAAAAAAEAAAAADPGNPDYDPTYDPTFSPPTFAAIALGREYRVLVVNRTGYSYGELEGAVPGSVTWELNAPGEFTFTMLTLDDKAGLAKPGREIQLWRGDQLLWWGPLVRPQRGSKETTYQCSGLLWYFDHRFFGKAGRVSALLNGDFEGGIAHWSFVGDVGRTISTDVKLTGRQSLRLVGHTSGEQNPLSMNYVTHDTYAVQKYVHPPGGHPQGDLMTLAGWAYIPSADYVFPADSSSGLLAKYYRVSDEFAPGVPRTIQVEQALINRSLTFDRWVRFEVTLHNVKEGHTVEVRLYPPHGVAYWDAVTLTYMESLSFGDSTAIGDYLGVVDQATIIDGIVRYAQDRFPGFVHGKSDLYIGTNCVPTGVKYSRAYQFAEHGQISQAINEFVTAASGVDISVEITPTTRTLTTHFPYKGRYRPELVLELGRNIGDFTESYDGEKAADNIIVLGPGDGPDREEAGAADPITNESISLEAIISAPEGTNPNMLGPLAAGELRKLRNPEVLEVVTHQGAGDLIGVLGLGDIVPVRIDHGGVQVNDTYRIVRISLDPKTEQMTLSLNKVDLATFPGTLPVTIAEAMMRFPRAVDACLAPGGGVWVVGSDGGVGNYGGAPFHGSMGGQALNSPMVAIVAHGSGGYWLVGADGGIFAFGNAPAKAPYMQMINTEYPRGDRAIVGAEASGADGIIELADDGATYNYP